MNEFLHNLDLFKRLLDLKGVYVNFLQCKIALLIVLYQVYRAKTTLTDLVQDLVFCVHLKIKSIGCYVFLWKYGLKEGIDLLRSKFL